MARIIPKKKFRRKSNSSVDKNCKDDETDRGSHATTNTNTSGYIPPNKSYHGPLHTNRQAKDVLDSHMPTNDKASQIIDTSYTHHSSPQQLPPTTAIDSDDDKTIDIRESSSSNDVVLMGEKSDVVNTQSPIIISLWFYLPSYHCFECCIFSMQITWLYVRVATYPMF